MLAFVAISFAVAAVSAQYGSNTANDAPAKPISLPIYYPPVVYDSHYYWDYDSHEHRHKSCPKIQTYLPILPGVPEEAFYPPVIRYVKYGKQLSALIVCDREPSSFSLLFVRRNESRHTRTAHLAAAGTTAGLTAVCDRHDHRFTGPVIDFTNNDTATADVRIVQVACLGLDKVPVIGLKVGKMVEASAELFASSMLGEQTVSVRRKRSATATETETTVTSETETTTESTAVAETTAAVAETAEAETTTAVETTAETTASASETTTAAAETTTAADETTTAAAETTASASETTAAASETTAAASETTSAAAETTTAASETTTAASETTTAASETTAAASETTSAASETTTAASETTTAVSETTTAATETTSAASISSIDLTDGVSKEEAALVKDPQTAAQVFMANFGKILGGVF